MFKGRNKKTNRTSMVDYGNQSSVGIKGLFNTTVNSIRETVDTLRNGSRNPNKKLTGPSIAVLVLCIAIMIFFFVKSIVGI